MRIITQEGTVPADSVLPTFIGLFPGLIDPLDIKVRDSFFTPSQASVIGRVPEVVVAGVGAWAATSVTLVQPGDGGFLEGRSTGRSHAYLDLGQTTYDVLGVFRTEAGFNSTRAIVSRYQDENNNYEIRLSDTTGGAVFNRVVGNVRTVIGAGSIGPAGEIVRAKLEVTPTSVRAYVDDVLIGEDVSTTFADATSAAIFIEGIRGRCLDFIAGW
ncbi:hypothetical protein [Oceaniovalibus sp. ACAM 378]|uniref:hypothetical protein n=1 Tax=Oceaniovalibus sp. ACAM 378 TaxID=2599923 RepID=UPI0011D7A3D0|nr:hypothetical protein [Oceaniovalibus sp. ACAM 378]TYB83932.1 hypothetical protein FQ320_23535 [Oceaniovalibus sp. ACAM 378]